MEKSIMTDERIRRVRKIRRKRLLKRKLEYLIAYLVTIYVMVCTILCTVTWVDWVATEITKYLATIF